MNVARVVLLALVALWACASNAASAKLGDIDCTQILKKWAEDPSSVPKHLVDDCKEKMAGIAPAAAALAATPAPAPEAVDPCAGPDAASSVHCWGPWSVLAPAAAPAAAALAIPEYPGDCESGNELDQRCVAQIDAPTPVDACPPGTPCGFATIVDGVTSSADVEDTQFVAFDLAGDGTSYTVDPDGANEIQSAGMTANVTPRPDGYEQMRSGGVDGDHQSRVVARVVRDDAGTLQLAADVWTDGDRSTRVARSGYFAWGVSTSQSGLELLNGNGVAVNFAGPMSVDNATNAALTVNFGSQPTWTGTWTNPAWSFGAGGAVTGVNLNSDPARFTSNVAAGSFVQGALLGEPGSQGIAHIIDVTLADRHIKDVGLLREVTTGPVGVGP